MTSVSNRLPEVRMRVFLRADGHKIANAQFGKAGIRINAEHVRPGRIAEDHHIIRRDHRHRMVKFVDHRLAQVILRPETPGQGNLGRDVFEKKRNRAIGVRAARHAIGDPRGKGPGFLVKPVRGGFDHFVDLCPPIRIVLWLRHHLPVSQVVKEAHEARPAAQKFGGQGRQIDQRRVEQRKLLVAIKDCQAGL